jgi:hypothetical protein
MITKLFVIISLNLILLLLNIPMEKDSLSVIGLLNMFGFSLYFALFSIIFLVINILKKNDRVLIVVNLISFLLFCLSFYWDILTFQAVDFSSLAQISIWYRLGPSLFFTFGVLVSLNFWFYRIFLKMK